MTDQTGRNLNDSLICDKIIAQDYLTESGEVLNQRSHNSFDCLVNLAMEG